MQDNARSRTDSVTKSAAFASLALLVPIATTTLIVTTPQTVSAQSTVTARAQDPGVRAGAVGAGEPTAGLTANETEYFLAGKAEFEEAEEVDEGLGPRLNLDSCGGCHLQPAMGGSSPAV